MFGIRIQDIGIIPSETEQGGELINARSWCSTRVGVILQRKIRGGLGKKTSYSKIVWWISPTVSPIGGRRSRRGFGPNRRRKLSDTTSYCWMTWMRSKQGWSSRRHIPIRMRYGRWNPQNTLIRRRSKWAPEKQADHGPKMNIGKFFFFFFVGLFNHPMLQCIVFFCLQFCCDLWK